MDPTLLANLVLIFGLACLVVFLCQRVRLPGIVGFLITGVLAGPHGLALLTDHQMVENLAEMGVVLLLFTIGMEFSFQSLVSIKKSVLLGGGLQVALTVVFTALVNLGLGRSLGQSVFWGFLASLSSTAIVLKLWQEKAALDSPPGRASLAILVFQDLIVIPMMLAVPWLAGAAPEGGSGWLLAAKGLGAMAVVAAGAKWLVPGLLNLVTATRDRELFLITLMVLCLAVAWLTSWAGLSLALGAFLAGLIISESPYSHQAIGNILPLRDIFTSMFFISIGMLLDLRVMVNQPVAVLVGTLALLALKTAATGLAVRGLGLPLRVAVQTGLALCQVGEFSFILAERGLHHHLLGQDDYRLFLVVSVLSMALTPLTLALGSSWGARLGKRASLKATQPAEAEDAPELEGHVVVVGYGINGRGVARACRAAGVPYTILEMNPETVRRERAQGENILYGDAINSAVLAHVGLAKARILVITISDPEAARHITATAKALNPGLHLIARTRFLGEMQSLRDLGADEVIPEEYETAVEIFARVLRHFLVPRPEISRLVTELRAEGYEMLRGLDRRGQGPACDISDYLCDMEIETLTVDPGSPASGRDLEDLALRVRYGVTVLAIRRGIRTMVNPQAQEVLKPRDLVVVMGSAPQVLAVAQELQTSRGQD